jgi:bacteriorhodopsin
MYLKYPSRAQGDIMPEFVVLTIFAIICFAVAKAAKGLVKYVLYVVTILLVGLAFSAAVTDLVFLVGLSVVAAGITVFYLLIVVYKKRKKPTQKGREGTVHIHNYW